jgi:hypothetical protein
MTTGPPERLRTFNVTFSLPPSSTTGDDER